MVLIVVAAVGLIVVTGVRGTRSVTGDPVAAETILPAGVTVTIRHVGAESASVEADDASVAGVLTDINSFWAATLPKGFGTSFVPLTGGYVSVDSTAAAGTTFCVSSPDQIAGNAYYCPTGDAIVYDSAGLVPVLLGHYGVAGLTASFAHEFGHVIQSRIGPTAAQRTEHPAQYPSILIEAQGDCYAGAFLAWAAGGHTDHVRLPASSMVRAVAPLLDFRDPVAVAATDPTAHGLGVDRLTAVLRGYRAGAVACHTLTRAAMTPTLGRPGLVSAPASARFAGRTAAIDAGRRSIAAFVATLPAATPGLPAIRAGIATARPAAGDLSVAASYGQFAAAATLAMAVGRSLGDTATGAACFTGAWARSVFGHAPGGQLGSWAGDADEALDMLRARTEATLAELEGFDDGFVHGWPSCITG